MRRAMRTAACAALAGGVALATAVGPQAFGATPKKAAADAAASARAARSAADVDAANVPAAGPAADGGWTGTWSVSPESGGPSFNQQTLRQIVHTSIGGYSARVEVSNVFGSQPLVVSD